MKAEAAIYSQIARKQSAIALSGQEKEGRVFLSLRFNQAQNFSIEQVWKEIKKRGLKNESFQTLEKFDDKSAKLFRKLMMDIWGKLDNNGF